MNISFLLFDRITILDAVGPLEVLGRLPGARVHLVGPEAGTFRASQNGLPVTAEVGVAEAPDSDIVVIPGGPGVRALLDSGPVLEWVRRQHRHTRWTTSVCTGSLLLGAAGLLEGERATTHWNAMDDLAAYGARAVSERVVVSGRLISAAGVSAGIDMALTLAAMAAGEDVARAIQLRIEYDPHPPFDCGTPAKAGERIVALARGGAAPAAAG